MTQGLEFLLFSWVTWMKFLPPLFGLALSWLLHTHGMGTVNTKLVSHFLQCFFLINWEKVLIESNRRMLPYFKTSLWPFYDTICFKINNRREYCGTKGEYIACNTCILCECQFKSCVFCVWPSCLLMSLWRQQMKAAVQVLGVLLLMKDSWVVFWAPGFSVVYSNHWDHLGVNQGIDFFFSFSLFFILSPPTHISLPLSSSPLSITLSFK